jgi:UDP-N-acetylglucosamine--N-acetylmuramyl-(pentapeptide) pyrophosphoryl-undecaprenol N-acetylglucosamine transferase
VTGGAQGAHRINRVVGAALTALLAGVQLVHQCGDNAFDDAGWLAGEAEGLPPALRARYRVVPFVTDALPDLYAAASLVIGRAGGPHRLCALGLPAVLIPLPAPAANRRPTPRPRRRQHVNPAPGADLSPEPRWGRASCSWAGAAREMRQRRSLATPDAAARLVDLILALARSR